MAEQDERLALFLPSVASRFNLSPHEIAGQLLHKAGITAPPYRWIRFECTSWLADNDGRRLLDGSFAPAAPPATLPELLGRHIPLTANYLLRLLRPDGTLFTRYEPLQDQLYEAIDLPRLAHAAWVLARAAHRDDVNAGNGATRIIEHLVSTIRETDDGCWLVASDQQRSVAELALLTLALCERPQHGLSIFWVPRLAATLWSRIDRRGRIDTHAGAIADAEP